MGRPERPGLQRKYLAEALPQFGMRSGFLSEGEPKVKPDRRKRRKRERQNKKKGKG